jgi:1-acyl-sn-glycerol-3-phosphate acyltransferase
MQAENRQAAIRRAAALINGIAGYLLIHVTIVVAFILFRVLNWTLVYGRRHLPLAKNTLLCANHRTMLDSYLIGSISSWPYGWLFPHILPFHPAASENFFRNRVLGWFSRRWRCIPVRRGQRDFDALRAMTFVLPAGQMLIFPEGTRSRTGALQPGRPGTGKLIHDTGCTVIPVYVRGMEQVLPIGSRWPRIFCRMEVCFGPSVQLDDLLRLEDSLETSKQIVERVMQHIALLEAQCEARLERRRARARAVKLALQRTVRFLTAPRG